MRQSVAATVTWQREVPESIRALDTFDHADYADLFSAPSDSVAGMEPAQIATTMLRPSSLRMRMVMLAAHLVQRYVLGLGRAPLPASPRLYGWRFAGGGDDWLRLEAESPLMSGHIVMQRGERELLFATFVRYNRRLGALVWPPVSRLHRRVGLALMRHAVRALP